MPVTAKDIANKLGLSQSTVSRILNGDRRQRIAADTRERVLETARTLEYRPNALARSLRRGRTSIVGLYTSHHYDARNDFLGEILGGLQHACARHRLDLLLHIGFAARSVDDAYNSLRDGRVDGLFLHTSPDDPLVERLGASGLHVVALADALPGLPCVTCDDADGMRQIVDHLWSRGYRRFAFIAPQFQLASVERRLQAWTALLRDRGVANADRSVIRIEGEEAAPAINCVLKPGRLPVAVSCWNDRTAYSLLRASLIRGIGVPEAVAVTGFDGFIDDKLPARSLVTVRCPWADLAVRATDLLVRRIEGDLAGFHSAESELHAADSALSETCLPVRLIAGDTT